MYAIHVYWISVCFLCGRGGVGDLSGFRDLGGVERGGMDEQGDDGDDSKASFSFNKALISVSVPIILALSLSNDRPNCTIMTPCSLT